MQEERYIKNITLFLFIKPLLRTLQRFFYPFIFSVFLKMQSRILSALFFITFLCPSCTEHGSSNDIQAQKDSIENQPFFPVTAYLRGQLKEIDSLPVTPLKITTHAGKIDSVWLKKEDIRPFAEPFLHPVIDSANLKNLFTGRSFLDQTINSFTFSYDPVGKLPDTVTIKRWDVYIDAVKNTVTRIYMVKGMPPNGSAPLTQTYQLTWKSNQWCKITTLTEKAGKQPDIREELMKWDFSE